jgi:hypothetical protein
MSKEKTLYYRPKRVECFFRKINAEKVWEHRNDMQSENMEKFGKGKKEMIRGRRKLIA